MKVYAVALIFLCFFNSNTYAEGSSSWDGLYVGVGIANAEQKDEGNSTGVEPDGNTAYNLNLPHSLSRNKTMPNLLIGYNWNKNDFIYGLEADIQWLNTSTGDCHAYDMADYVIYGEPYTKCNQPWGSTSFSTKTDWITSERIKLGLVHDRFLLYSTAGLALGKVASSLTTNCLPSGCGRFDDTGGTGAVVTTTNWSNIKAGWTLGLGIEAKLNNQLSVRTEYQYIDLGSDTHSASVPSGYGSLSKASFSSDLTYSLIKLQMNYSF